MKSFIFGALGAIFVLISAAIIMPQYSDYRAQSEISDWLNIIHDTQLSINSKAISAGSLNDVGKKIMLPRLSSKIDYFEITNTGTILIKGGLAGQFIALIPTIKDGEVNWVCIGGSNEHMVSKCKSP